MLLTVSTNDEPEAVPTDAKAPNAARLVRRIAAAERLTRFAQAEIARRLGLDEQSQVNRWWSGGRAIGDENRDRIAEAFPAFVAELDAAIAADKKLARARKKKKRGAAHPKAAETGPIPDDDPLEKGIRDIRAALAFDDERSSLLGEALILAATNLRAIDMMWAIAKGLKMGVCAPPSTYPPAPGDARAQ